jgi:hypothetical protein
MRYKVYFEIYGKKMVAEVEATTQELAKKTIKDKIFFHKVEPQKIDTPDISFFNDIFKGFK